MAYLGFFERFTEIGGKPVDLSRLDEGILMAGDDEYDADAFIDDDDRLEVFNETALKTKDELVQSLDDVIARIKGESRTNPEHSPAFYDRYRKLVVQFRDEIQGKTFPSALEAWWRYEYEVRESGAVLKLSHIDVFRFGRDDAVEEHIDTTFTLLEVKTKLLTVEQYAQLYGVTTIAVRQWIRRGKIRTAVKAGSEWRIPELADSLSRKYGYRTYTRKEILTDLPAEYAYFNKYDSVDLSQDEEHKNMYIVCFAKKHDFSLGESEKEIMRKYYKAIMIDQKERERFELYLIANPFVEADEVTFVSRSY